MAVSPTATSDAPAGDTGADAAGSEAVDCKLNADGECRCDVPHSIPLTRRPCNMLLQLGLWHPAGAAAVRCSAHAHAA